MSNVRLTKNGHEQGKFVFVRGGDFKIRPRDRSVLSNGLEGWFEIMHRFQGNSPPSEPAAAVSAFNFGRRESSAIVVQPARSSGKKSE